MVAAKLSQSHRGVQYSVLLHGILLALLVFGLPKFFNNPFVTESTPTWDLVTDIKAVTNIPPSKPQLVPPKHHSDRNTAIKPTQTASNAAAHPVMPLHNNTIRPLVHETSQTRINNLDSVLQSVANMVQKDQSSKPTQTALNTQSTVIQNIYVSGAPLSLSETDAIIQQIRNKWNSPVGAKDAENLKVALHIEVNPDGTITSVQFTGDKGRYDSDSFFRAAVDSAIRAAHMASPLQNLPADKYYGSKGWNAINADFDPKDMP